MLAQTLDVLQYLLMPLVIGALVVGGLLVYFVGRRPGGGQGTPPATRPSAQARRGTDTRPPAPAERWADTLPPVRGPAAPPAAPSRPTTTPEPTARRTAPPVDARPPAPARPQPPAADPTPAPVLPRAEQAPPRARATPAAPPAAPTPVAPRTAAPVAQRPPAPEVAAPVPAAAVPPAEPPTAAPAAALPWVADLLLVDDSAVVRAKLRKVFEPAGYQVALARDGAEALSLLGQHRYSLMVTDLEMPNVDGEALIRATQQNPATADMPILAITGHEDLQLRLNQLTAISGIYRKPWIDEDLLGHVQSLVTPHRVAALDSQSEGA